MRGERGFALVITLVITALLVALTTEFISEVFVDTSARQNFVDGQQASILAGSGIEGASKILQYTLSGQRYSSLSDQWAKPLKIEDERGSLQVTIEEENGKLNLNAVVLPNGEFDTFYYGVATRLFKKQGLTLDLLDALADWVDGNDVPRPGGAETAFYAALKPPYEAKNARLETLEELALIKGFDAKSREALRPLVTVYAEDPKAPAPPININTAPKEVIAALDEKISDDLAQRVLDYRKTTPFKNKAELSKVPGFETIATGLMTNTTIKGSLFRIRSQARVNETSRVVEAVARLGGSRPVFLYWREF